MTFNLLVIRSATPTALAKWYTRFGLTFDHHRHGKGPMHYAAEVNGVTLEIYPLKKSQTAPDLTLRLGFTVQDLDAAVAHCVDLISPPTNGEWGYRAVVADPEGRRVELVEAS